MIFGLRQLLLVLIVVLLQSRLGQVEAQTSEQVRATVKIHLCGDQQAEGPEQCDGVDLQQRSCRQLGFFGGTLSCDQSCEFNLENCSGVAPTPIPSPIVLSEEENQNTANSEIVTSNTPVTTTPIANNSQTISSTVPLAQQSQTPELNIFQGLLPLPTSLAQFDTNDSGRLSDLELESAINSWISAWSSYANALGNSDIDNISTTCDLDQNDLCNAVDFSVLLHYVESEE